jgi:hypothetical protein
VVGRLKKLSFLRGGGACLLPQDKESRRLGSKNTSLLDEQREESGSQRTRTAS